MAQPPIQSGPLQARRSCPAPGICSPIEVKLWSSRPLSCGSLDGAPSFTLTSLLFDRTDTCSSAWRPCGRNSSYSTERSKSPSGSCWAEPSQMARGLPGKRWSLEPSKASHGAGREAAGGPEFQSRLRRASQAPTSPVWAPGSSREVGGRGSALSWRTGRLVRRAQALRRFGARALDGNRPGPATSRVTRGESTPH